MFTIQDAIQNNCVAELMEEAKRKEKVKEIFPLLTHAVDLKQNEKYHGWDVYDHTVVVVRSIQMHHHSHLILLLAGLVHDNGKGRDGIRGENKEGKPNDIGHEKAGVSFAKEYLEKEGFNNEIIQKVLFLTEYHGIHFTADSEEEAKVEVSHVKDKTIRKALKKIREISFDKKDFENNLWLLFEFKKMDALGFNTKNGFSQKQYQICELMYPRYMTLAIEME